MSDPLAPDPNFHETPPEDIQMTMKDIGRLIGSALPRGYGFNLLIFDFGEGGSMFYISNARRRDMLKLMKEFIEKEEAKHGK